MKKVLPVTLVCIAVVGFFVLLNLDGTAQEAKEKSVVRKVATKEASTAPAIAKVIPFKPVAPMGVLMDVADTMFYDLEDKLKQKKFKTIRKHALFLAEVINVTQYGYKKKDKQKKEWIDYCKKSIDDLVKMSVASKAKKEPEIKQLFKSVEKLCNDCHDDFEDSYK